MFEPLPDGPAAGQYFHDLDGLLDEYYGAFGWDIEEGTPTAKKLAELDMTDIAGALPRG
jgi:aldehyde:ferredoxin oxidoreductase